jgi:tetratricopeptide (TPR) repeat protein
MMRTFLLISLSCFILVAQAQENQYEKAMKNALEKLNQAQMGDQFFDVANTFERIGLNEPGEWLPLYYAAYANIVISYETQDVTQKEALLDKAQKFVDSALKLAPKESELYTLQAFLYPSRIMVDPMGRGAEYMGKIYQALDEATRLNPDNPRIYFLKAISTLNMPVEFGGGPEVAKPIFLTAKEKFDKFQPATSLSPNWGKETNEAELNKL